MARNKGQFPFSANFEVKNAAAIDPRVAVDTKAELINKETWPYDGNTIYLYDGLLVSVKDEKSIYMLVDRTKALASDYSGWQRVDVNAGKHIQNIEGKQPLTIKFDSGSTEGTNQFTYNVESAKNVNITPESINASRETHTHPTSISSNATTNLSVTAGGTTDTINDLYATYTDQLRTARTISLSGDASGSVSFNGSANVTIPVTIADNSHNHTISNISNLNSGWDNLLSNAPSVYITRWPSISEVTNKQNLVIKLNGGSTEGTNQFTFNGVTSKSVNITPETIGAQAAGNYMTTDTAQSITGAKTSIANPWSVRMSVDTSNAIAGLMWKNTSGSNIAGLTYHNTAKRIFINANMPEVTDIWSDTAGKYSLRIGWNELTYNNYPILRSDNIGSYALTPSNYTSTLDSRYVKKTGDTITGDLKLSGSSIFIPESSSNTAFTGILDETGTKAILAYFEDDTYCGLNTGTHYIRSGNTHLIHRKGSSDYTIFDSGNYTNWVYTKSQIDSNLKNYLPLAGGTMDNGAGIKWALGTMPTLNLSRDSGLMIVRLTTLGIYQCCRWCPSTTVFNLQVLLPIKSFFSAGKATMIPLHGVRGRSCLIPRTSAVTHSLPRTTHPPSTLATSTSAATLWRGRWPLLLLMMTFLFSTTRRGKNISE